MEEIKKTSEEWLKELYPDYVILDPDGWDRTNFDYSFNKELITEDEFKLRFMKSTIMYDDKFIN
jgi:hypothetical protein